MEFVTETRQELGFEMDDLKQRKADGLKHLEENDFKEAVNIYKQILTDYPDDIESYLLLGDLYLANEDYPSAEKLYQNALRLEPDNVVIQRRVKLSTLELVSHSDEEIPTDSDSVTKLLQNLTGRAAPVSEKELQNAAQLLDSIVHSNNPAQIVAKNLEQIDNLLPALIELNIRQARFDRRFDLVNLLQSLQEEISVLMIESGKNDGDPENSADTKTDNEPLLSNVLFLLPDLENISERASCFLDLIKKKEIDVTLSAAETVIDEKPDLVICFNPHLNSKLIELLANYSAQHIPIVLDLDDDFEYMPINHPDYTLAGLGSLEKSRSYTAALVFSSLITVPGESMAAHIREYGYKVEVVPFGWSKSNEQWLKPHPQRSTVNIGLIGIQGSFEDVQKYRRIIVRVLREFPQTRLVVCGDPVTYKMFENISENRRVFLPQVPDEDMPYILNQIDILLVPLNVTPYHLVTTDRVLMQAGVKGIPWIASPMPDFIQWHSGGITAENLDEWHSYLRQFIQDNELRNTLGQAGRNRAQHREESEICSRLSDLLKSIK